MVDPVETRCKILFRILTWLLSWLNLKPPTKNSYNKIYEIGFQRGKKKVNKRKKKTMPATKVAGFAWKNLALNILAAKLQKELHGEKMLLTKHLKGLCKGRLARIALWE